VTFIKRMVPRGTSNKIILFMAKGERAVECVVTLFGQQRPVNARLFFARIVRNDDYQSSLLITLMH